MILFAPSFFARLSIAAGLLPAVDFTAVLTMLIVACGAEATDIPTESPTATTPSATATATGPPETPTPAATATSTPAPTDTPSPAATPTPQGPLVSLPADEAPHETPVEWWYFNGFLWYEDGRVYSFHYVTFQSPTTPVGTPHLLHATLGDHEGGTHFAGERGTLAVLDPAAPSVDVNAAGWVMRGDGEGYELAFDLGGTVLELMAASSREPVLHDSTGLVNLGEAGDTYYYSRTRMELDGWVDDGDGRRAVSGSGWMDHQWGEISRADVGWDWVNLQLADGSDLMVAVVWKPIEPPVYVCIDAPCAPPPGERVAAYATYVDPDGVVTHVPGEGVSLDALTGWVSPETGIEYPMGWQLVIEPLDIDLLLFPLVVNAEFDAGVILPVVYWEGPIVVSHGSIRGNPVEGRGFVELVGYDPEQGSADIPMPR